MTTSPAPRKPRALGPVHLFPEPPHKLGAGSRVALAIDTARRGRVRTVNPSERLVVEWENGDSTVELRDALVAVFTTETPKPRRKAA